MPPSGQNTSRFFICFLSTECSWPLTLCHTAQGNAAASRKQPDCMESYRTPNSSHCTTCKPWWEHIRSSGRTCHCGASRSSVYLRSHVSTDSGSTSGCIPVVGGDLGKPIRVCRSVVYCIQASETDGTSLLSPHASYESLPHHHVTVLAPYLKYAPSLDIVVWL